MRVEGVSPAASAKRIEPINKEVQNADMVYAQKKNTNQQNEGSRKATEEEIIAAIEAANKHFEIFDKRLEFSIHEKTKQILVKIVDSNTDEVIKEIPSEKILDMIANMMELAGLLVNEKA
ncbi:MAG: flagellar protein FlaG [Clostridia bacterium]|nr:flagellar protein FlaG [Clostridia bacterium]